MRLGVCSAGRVVAVISPADRLLGRGIALELAGRRFDVALIGEDEAILREIALAVLHIGGRVLAVKAGTSGPETVSAGIHEICDRLGPIEVWVALDAECSAVDGSDRGGSPRVRRFGAGIFGWGLLDAVAIMSERHHGTVISVESTLAFIPSAALPELCAAAFARAGCSRHCDARRSRAVAGYGSAQSTRASPCRDPLMLRVLLDKSGSLPGR